MNRGEHHPPSMGHHLGGPASTPSTTTSNHHHHNHHHPHPHMGMGMGPGVPPPPQGSPPSGSSARAQHQHVHHARNHSGAGVRDREGRGGRERGLSTSSITSLATGPPPSSGGSTSTVGPGVAGPALEYGGRERSRQMAFQRESMQPPPPAHREERDVQMREPQHHYVPHPHHHHPPHHHAHPHPHQHQHHAQGQPQSGLAAVAAAADAISSSIPGGIGPAVVSQHQEAQAQVANGNGAGVDAPAANPNPSIVNGNSSASNGTSTTRRAAPQAGSATLARIGRSFEVIRAEYDAAVGELNVVKGVKEEWEGKVMSQVAELNAIRKALYDLETAHTRIKESYEAEIGKVKMELRAAKQEQQQQFLERERAEREMLQREREQQVRAEQERDREREQQQLGMPPPHPVQQQQQHIQLGGPGQPPLVSQPPPQPPIVQMGPPPVHAGGTGSGRTTPSMGAAGSIGGGRRERESPRIPHQPQPGDRESQSVFYRPGGLERGLSRVPDERGPPELRTPRDERPLVPNDRERATTRGERDREREREERIRERAEERMRLERMQEREREKERDRDGGREYKRSRVGSGASTSGVATPGGARGPPGRHQQQVQQLGQPQEGYYQQQQPLPYPGPHQQQQQQSRPQTGMGVGMGGQQQPSQGPPAMQMQMQHGVPTPRFPPVPGTLNTGGVGLEAPGSGNGVAGEGSMDVDGDVNMRPPGETHPHAQPHAHSHPEDNMELKRSESYYQSVSQELGPFPGMMDLGELPLELRMEGEDWWAVCNPRKVKRQPGGGLKRPLDVVLVHSLMHESVVCCVKFSADGKFLATGSNRSAQIYNTQSGQKMCTLVDEDAVTGKQGDLYIRSVCFSPCGRWLATGAEDKVVRIWDIAKQKIRSVFDGHQQEIYALEFSLDGRLLVSGSGDKTARVWDVSTVLGPAATENGTLPSAVGDATRPTVLAIEDNAAEKMPDLDVYADEDGERVGDGENGRRVREGAGEDAMSVEGANGENGAGEVEPAADSGITCIAVSPDGRFVAAGSLDCVIRLWDLRPPPSLASAGGASGPSSPGAPSRPKMIERLKGHKDSVYSVSFTRDGRFLVSASLDKGVRVWDVGHLGIVPWAGGPGPADVSLLPSPTQPGDAAKAKRKTRCVTQFVGHRDFVLSVAVSHDGRWVVSGSKDRGVMWWEVPAGAVDLGVETRDRDEEDPTTGLSGKDAEAACVLQGHKNSVISIDLSPVGNLLATGSGDWQARIWTYKTD